MTTIDDLLGQFAYLPILRFVAGGALLAVDPDGPGDETLVLPADEVPRGAKPGDSVDVFVYLDSEDHPTAATREPRLTLGEVTFLEVTSVAPFGAFVDWGLPKELLVHHSAQTQDVRVGERHPIGLVRDETGRLAGTMRVTEMLGTPRRWKPGHWVDGEAWRFEPSIGLFVIVERCCVGLLPSTEPHRLSRGDAARFRVAEVLPDGKIVLSLRRPAVEEIERDAEKIRAILSRRSAPQVGDHSSPEQIRATFGISKKAFKRAVGRLLKEGQVEMDEQGHVRVL